MIWIERAFAMAAGLLMIAAALPGAPVVAVPVAAGAAVLVVGSVRYRAFAVAAVLATIVVLVVGDPGIVQAAAAGLASVVYLLGLSGSAALNRFSLGGAIALTAVALTAAALPVEIAWLPLVAPVAVVLVFALLSRSAAWSRDGQDDIRQRGRVAVDHGRGNDQL